MLSGGYLRCRLPLRPANPGARSAGNPAEQGSILVVYATGEGQTDPAGVDGRLASEVSPRPVAEVEVTIGGLPAETLYAGAAPFLDRRVGSGVMQVNARMDRRVGSGDQPVRLRVGERMSQEGVTAAVR